MRKRNIAQQVSNKKLPVTEPLPGQVKNNAGGFAWEVNPKELLDRFLMIGTVGGTYYQGETKLNKEHYKNIVVMLEDDFKYVIDRAVEISKTGRSISNTFPVFTLAVAACDKNVACRLHALSFLKEVCRTSNDLFAFVSFVTEFSSMGRAKRRAIADWYNSKTPHELALQLIKYRQRDGWTHKDVLRLARPKLKEEAHSLIRWAVNEYNLDESPVEVDRLVEGFIEINKLGPENKGAEQIVEKFQLTREMIPTELLKDPKVSLALLKYAPPQALIRNLANNSRVGILERNSEGETLALKTLTDEDKLRRARIHPFKVMLALWTYQGGANKRGSTWSINTKIVDALDEAFYKSFGFMEQRKDKKIFLAIDESGSMGATITGASRVTCTQAATAFAMTVHQKYDVVGTVAFDTKYRKVDLSPRRRLDDNIKRLRRGGGTNMSQAVQAAIDSKKVVDAIVIFTDNESWVGLHTSRIMETYRKRFNPNAKLIVLNMVANRYTNANPNDILSFNAVGVDANLPDVVDSFIG